MQKQLKSVTVQIKREVLDFLSDNVSAVVATSFKNVPYASTMYYVVDKNFNFYFLTRRSTDKYLNLIENNNVAIVVGTGPGQISFKARGHMEILSGRKKREVRDKLFFTLKDKGIKSWPIKTMKYFQNGEGENDTNIDVVLKFTPVHMSFMNLDNKKYPASLSNDFHSL